MALVTRCPFCGAVWRLPSREIADRGPVKCAECMRSYDAMSQMLEVPDDVLDALYQQAQAQAEQKKETSTQTAETKILTTPLATETLGESSHLTPAEQPTSKQPTVLSLSTEPTKAPRISLHSEIGKATTTDSKVVPANITISQTPIESSKTRTEPTLSTLTSTEQLTDTEMRTVRLQTKSEKQSLEETQRKLSSIIPAQATSISAPKTPTRSVNPSREITPHKSDSSSIWSWIIGVLFLLLVAIIAIILNQQIMRWIPVSAPVFHKICGKIPCPNYYVQNASQFKMGEPKLYPIDSIENYRISVTMTNTGVVPAAFPHLQVQLINASNQVTSDRILTPADYLTPLELERQRIAPGHSLEINFSLKSKTAATRTHITPVDPKDNSTSVP